MMTQVCLIDGEYADAVKWADEGLALQPDEAQLGAAHAAAHISRQAAAEIAEGKDVLRNQLRLVRALVWVDAAQAAMNLAEKIPTSSPYYREAMWSIAAIGSTATPSQPAYRGARRGADDAEPPASFANVGNGNEISRTTRRHPSAHGLCPRKRRRG